jgi:hypothetical protein
MLPGTRTTAPWAVALLAALATPALAQQAVVNFKTLQQFLPAVELAGYMRGKPTGETASAMGMATSQATVVYTRQAPPSPDASPPTITVTIADMSGTGLGAFALLAQGMGGEISQETEHGYTKSITVRNQYKGTEEATTTPDDKSSKITLFVGSRFMVTLEGYQTDQVALLHKLLDATKLEELEKAGQAKR